MLRESQVGDVEMDIKERALEIPNERVTTETLSEAGAVCQDPASVATTSQSVVAESLPVVHHEEKRTIQRTEVADPTLLPRECERVEALTLAMVTMENLQLDEDVCVPSAPLYPVMDSLMEGKSVTLTSCMPVSMATSYPWFSKLKSLTCNLMFVFLT